MQLGALGGTCMVWRVANHRELNLKQWWMKGKPVEYVLKDVGRVISEYPTWCSKCKQRLLWTQSIRREAHLGGPCGWKMSSQDCSWSRLWDDAGCFQPRLYTKKISTIHHWGMDQGGCWDAAGDSRLKGRLGFSKLMSNSCLTFPSGRTAFVNR